MAESTRHRIVLDTNTIIAAGSAWVMSNPPTPQLTKTAQRLIYCVAAQHTGLICGEIAGEYLEKLIDLKHPTERVIKYIAYLLGAFTRVSLTSTTCTPAPADPDDVVFILCAIDGAAHFLVTDDKHLLALKDAYNPPKIVTHGEAAAILVLS